VKPKSKLKGKTEDRPWLREKVYDPKRQRTVELVKRTVDCLLKDKLPVSLASLAARSKELDPEGRGVSETAILNNEEARKYYERHRGWRGKSRKRPAHSGNAPEITAPIKIDRNLSRARYRYLKMSKAELAARLLAVEQKCAEQEEQWLQVNEELMTWRLRAERAEARIRAELEQEKRVKSKS
jgi:hypothetical protein